MTLEQHPAITDARGKINRLFNAGPTTFADDDAELDRIIAAAVSKVCREEKTKAYENAKEIYRDIHGGGCRMPSAGDDCDCFLCMIDRVANLQPPTTEVSE